MPPHPFEAAREATLAALVALAGADPRIAALWLQGSLAAGGADPFSDIDAYLAARDADDEPLQPCRRCLASNRRRLASMALTPSERKGSGSHSGLRWLTHGRRTRSERAPVIRSASVRPAVLLGATPAPPKPPAQASPVDRSKPTLERWSRVMPMTP